MNTKRAILSVFAGLLVTIIILYYALNPYYHIISIAAVIVAYYWGSLFPAGDGKEVRRKDPFLVLVEIGRTKLGQQLGIDNNAVNMGQVQFKTNRHGEIAFQLKSDQWIFADGKDVEYPPGTNRVFTHMKGAMATSSLDNFSIASKSLKLETAVNFVAEQLKIPKSKIYSLAEEKRGDEAD